MDDIYYNILTFLEIPNIYNCCQINKQFYNVTKYEQLWKKYYLDNYDDYDIVNNYYDTCKKYYCMLKLNEKYQLFDNLKDLNNSTNFCLMNLYITIIPTELGILKKLRILRLSNNNIKVIPSKLAQLTNLECLVLSNNPIETTPNEIIIFSKTNNLKFM